MACRILGWVVAAALVFNGATAYGQAITGTITGRVVDNSGAVLPGVSVAIKSPQMVGTREAVTDQLGTYRFTALAPGTYSVSFTLASFSNVVVEGVVVTANASMTVNAPMQLSNVAETVTVISNTPTIDLQSTQVGVNWSEQQMEDLPYGRGIRGLARLVPGLSPTQFDVGGNTVGGSTTTGARSY
jgi:hypothetical protein